MPFDSTVATAVSVPLFVVPVMFTTYAVRPPDVWAEVTRNEYEPVVVSL